MNCQCVNQAPHTIGSSTGKTCEGSTKKGFAGEPFCWIKSSLRYACTDAQRDNSQAEAGKLATKTSNWYYSTMPCISKSNFNEKFASTIFWFLVLTYYWVFIFDKSVAPSKPWADAYKCPKGAYKTIWNSKKGYLRNKAKCLCQTACEKESSCKYANLRYTHSKATMSCTLMDSRCEDWRNTRDGNYYLYQKGNSQNKILLICIKIT